MPEQITLNLYAQESAPYIMLLLQHYPNTKQFYPYQLYSVTTPATTENQATEIRIQLSHILLAFDKPTAGTKEDNAAPATRYYAVIKDRVLGRGSFGVIRPVRGTWKIDDGQALFKIKQDCQKLRVLKTLFFIPEPNNTHNTASANFAIMAAAIEHHEAQKKNEQIASLRQEQLIASYTPHLSTKYPIIETNEGLHLLMRRQPGGNLSELILCLQKNQQQISVIQRLLLCLELYETLEQEVHSVATTQGRLIHRDIKPENIMSHQHDYIFKTHVLDYGLSTTSDAKLVPGIYGTPLYMDPEVYSNINKDTPPSTANDLFAVAIICAKIWGDTRRQAIAPEYLVEENQNIQFDNLFANIVCSDKLKDKLLTLFNQTTRYSSSQRLGITETVLVYKQLLLCEYEKITTKLPELKPRLDALNEQLKKADYLSLDYATRIKFDREYLAADFLVHVPDAVKQCDSNKCLYDIWLSYSQDQLKCINTLSIHQGTPTTLAKQITNLIQHYKQLNMSPTAQTLISIIDSWTMLRGLSDFFSHLVRLTPQNIHEIHQIFDNTLNNRSIGDKIKTIKRLVYIHLINYFKNGLCDNKQCTERVASLCVDAVQQETQSDSKFFEEWHNAIKLLNLNHLLKKLWIYNSGELTQALEPEHSFQEAFQSLNDYYKQCIIVQLDPVTALEQINTSPNFFNPIKNTIKNTITGHLLSEVDLIFKNPKIKSHEIPDKVRCVVDKLISLLVQPNNKHHSQTVDALYKAQLNLLEMSCRQYNDYKRDL